MTDTKIEFFHLQTPITGKTIPEVVNLLNEALISFQNRVQAVGCELVEDPVLWMDEDTFFLQARQTLSPQDLVEARLMRKCRIEVLKRELAELESRDD